VRWLSLSVGLLFLCSTARAQQQENKLIDRLLRPNMKLVNSAQNKNFTAVEGVSVDRKFSATELYRPLDRQTKSFGGTKRFPSKTFRTGKYAGAEAAAKHRPDADVGYASTVYKTNKSSLTHESSFATKKVNARDYGDNRPFLAEGTRQKQLSQQDKPMSIEDIRELLNKNR
jgi:hypothetical protein